MKTAVVLRHAERRDRSDNLSHLSQEGIEQARAAGSAFQRFDLVVTSPLPRAYETAIAMGFAVTRTHASIQDIGEPILRQVNWSDGFAAWAAAYRTIAVVRSYSDYIVSLLRGWLAEVAEGGSLLVVSHGGIVEAMAAGLRPEADWVEPAVSAGYAEGFSAALDSRGGHDLVPIRADKDRRGRGLTA
jgi:broad specificity phosphatase PhoE